MDWLSNPSTALGTIMSLNLDSFSLSACLKQSMKLPVSLTQTVGMLEITLFGIYAVNMFSLNADFIQPY